MKTIPPRVMIDPPSLGKPVVIGTPRCDPNSPVSWAVPRILRRTTLRVFRSTADNLPRGGAMQGAPSGPSHACTTAG